MGPSGPSATPSPPAPSRAISTSRMSAAMARADQEFDIAAATADRRGHDALDRPPRGLEELPDAGDGFRARRLRAHHPALAHGLPAGLELRLDQSDQPGARRGER